MKHFYLLFFTVFAIQTTQAQIINIPDANFKNALLNHIPVIDTNGDNEIQVTEAESLINLEVSNNNISSLSGLEYFINLEELNCSNNQITSIDLSNLTELNELRCSFNQLTSLDTRPANTLHYLQCDNNQISTLDFGGFLHHLYCQNNQLTQLTYQQLVGNGFLRFLNCSDNLLTSLHLPGYTQLISVRCANNQITSIVAGNNDPLYFLQSLDCSNNELESLTVNGFPELYGLVCYGNSLTTLDISNNPYLGELYCSNNELESLLIKNGGSFNEEPEFDNNPNLEYICADDFEISQIQTLANNYGYTSVNIGSDCPALSVEETELINLKIYPNPVKNKLLIDGLTNIESVTIYDISGRIVNQVSYYANQNTIEISTVKLTQGTYFVKVKTDLEEGIKKIVKE